MKIIKHLLKGEGINFIKSPNHGGKLENEQPDSIVIHYTAGGSAEGAIKSLCNPGRKASAHVVISRDGAVTQLVPFDTIAWHAGKSSFDGRESFNKFSVGIEMDNAGKLEKTEAGFTSWFGRDYPANEVIHATHRNKSEAAYWHKYTEEQIAETFELCSILMQTYPIKLVVGHEEISPSRKIDPGPAFPLDKLRDRLIVRDRAEEGADEEVIISGRIGIVTASRLNIRSEPRRGASTVRPPLPLGMILDIVEESNGWYNVDVRTRGWVSKEYVST